MNTCCVCKGEITWKEPMIVIRNKTYCEVCAKKAEFRVPNTSQLFGDTRKAILNNFETLRELAKEGE